MDGQIHFWMQRRWDYFPDITAKHTSSIHLKMSRSLLEYDYFIGKTDWHVGEEFYLNQFRMRITYLDERDIDVVILSEHHLRHRIVNSYSLVRWMLWFLVCFARYQAGHPPKDEDFRVWLLMHRGVQIDE